MKIRNYTHYKIDTRWLTPILRSLKVDPSIKIEYADDPKTTKKPNYRHKLGAKYHDLDGLAIANRVYLFCGKWSRGKYHVYTQEFVRWVLLHELRHVYYYSLPRDAYPWKGATPKEMERREEMACDKYANKIMGVRKRSELTKFDDNAESKIQITRSNKRK